MIPKELIELNRWCAWRYVERDEKMIKMPIDPKTNSPAKSNDESTWSDYETAVNFPHKDGLGFFFKPPYIGIDLDDVSSEIERYKQGDFENNIVFDFYESVKSYGEISPSGNGIHIITKGKLPGYKRRKGDVEVYDSGRFFTMTGNTLNKYSTVDEVSDVTLDRLYKKYLEPQVVDFRPQRMHGVSHTLSESEVVRKIIESKQAQQFKLFMDGGWENFYSSQSEADLAFANMLAFWCARDFSQMDSLFRQSSLMRDKWDAKRGKTTYGEATLYKAINDTSEVFKPIREKPKYNIEFAAKKEEKKELSPQSYDDTGNAKRMMELFGDIIRYSYIHKKFYVYNGEKWEVDQSGKIRVLIDDMIEQMKYEKVPVAEGVDEEDAKELFRKHIKRSRQNSSKKNLEDELKHHVAIMPEDFDSDDMLMNVSNGYLDLSSGELKPHDKEKMFAKQANAEYSEKMTPDVWIDFLNDIFDHDSTLIHYLQKALGYSLTGSTKEQVMFILHGKGRNGKSIFVETISEIMGDYAQNIRASSLMVKRNEGVNNDIATLQDARLVTSSEPNEGFRFDEGLVKQLTGGDRVTARFLYGEDFEFTPKFKIWVTTNHKPIVRGTDDGIWRRLVLIPFEVQIPADRVDKDLKYKLLREAPGILEWMLEGCRMWQRYGLQPPKRIAEASKEYRNEMDTLEHFITEECQRGEGYRAPAGELYTIYKKWADDTGEFKMNKNTFGKKMKEKFESIKSSGRIHYQGIKIKEVYPGLSKLK